MGTCEEFLKKTDSIGISRHRLLAMVCDASVRQSIAQAHYPDKTVVAVLRFMGGFIKLDMRLANLNFPIMLTPDEVTAIEVHQKLTH